MMSQILKYSVVLLSYQFDQSTQVLSYSRFANNSKGFAAFEKWLEKQQISADIPLVFTMEATGVYHEELAWYLFEKDFHLSIVLANKSKAFFKAIGLKSKNDKIDAQGLALMGALQKLTKWQPLSPKLWELRKLNRHRDFLQKQKTQVRNQQHSLTQGKLDSQLLEKQYQSSLKLLEKQIKELEQAMQEMVEKDKQLQQKAKQVCSIPGIGMLTFIALIAETNGFALFENQRQLISYAGYDVVENQSGKRQGKTRISKKGNSHIRKALQFPALVAVKKQDSIFQKLYQGVYGRTKIKMKGYVAVQKKILVLVYTLYKSGQEFDLNYQSEEPKPYSKAEQNALLLQLVA